MAMGERAAVVGLVVALLVGGADGHGVMLNPRPRGRLAFVDAATQEGQPDADDLNSCASTVPGEATATYRPGDLVSIQYEVTIAHVQTPGVRVALRFPGGDFEVLEGEDQNPFVDRTAVDDEDLTSTGLHNVTVRLPATGTCEGPALTDLCQLQWVIISETAHGDSTGGYSIGCADVQISTTAPVDDGYGPPPSPPTDEDDHGIYIVQVGTEGSCEEQETQIACEALSDAQPVYKRCTWMEQVGLDGECVDAGFEWKTFTTMLIVAGAGIFVAGLWAVKKNHGAVQDKNLKMVKSAHHLKQSSSSGLGASQANIGEPNRDAHGSEKALMPRALPALPAEENA